MIIIGHNVALARAYNTFVQTISPYIHLFGFGGSAARFKAFASFVVRFPISQPQPRRILTTFGVTAAAIGTRMKMKDLWMAYANASCVARPKIELESASQTNVGAVEEVSKGIELTRIFLVSLIGFLDSPPYHFDRFL
jgi:hypothetical protein